ncbi:MAG: RdgB/HAM1 family non-canonical purine NTP pyrophosphatase [Bacteroidetes bacterium]|nr:RdgB/HAM1 family non-canonical purine NTP pyrophosphatase [Bacteroidota bacterium]
MKIVLATNNSHKINEIQQIFNKSFLNEVEVINPSTILEKPLEVDEIGLTLEENAYLKAIALFSATGIASLSDDTGLEIEALGNSPGVKSARYSGENATDIDNRRKVLNELTGTLNRLAQFRTVLCFYDGVRTIFSEGICKGEILLQERGEQGFGYDSIFKPSGLNKSFAEMPLHEKNLISHRGLALKNMMSVFENYYK